MVKTNITSALKKIVISVTNYFGYEIIPISASTSLDNAVKRLIKKESKIGTIIDIGASNGSWSKRIMGYFPLVDIILVEANQVHEEQLKLFSMNHNNVKYHLCAAGNIDGDCFFDGTDPFGGLASLYPISYCEKQINCTMKRVDTIITESKGKPPYLLKLDTHGFEVPIFEGAEKTLVDTNIIIVESYNLIYRIIGA